VHQPGTLGTHLQPRILYLASSGPAGGGFGGQLRAWHVGRALKEIGPVSLMVVSLMVVSSDADDAV